MTKKHKIIAIIYTVLSVLALPFLLFMQLFSVFLFDSPGSMESVVPYTIALAILGIPICLIIANIKMWGAYRHNRMRVFYWSIAAPFVYVLLFFMTWGLFDS